MNMLSVKRILYKFLQDASVVGNDGKGLSPSIGGVQGQSSEVE